MAKQTRKKSSGAGLGVALGAAALASVGAYLLYGSKHAKQNRQKVKSWALKAKAEVLEQVEKVKHLDADEYKAVIDKVLARYQGVQGVAKQEVIKLGKELKAHWGDLAKVGGSKKRAKRSKK